MDEGQALTSRPVLALDSGSQGRFDQWPAVCFGPVTVPMLRYLGYKMREALLRIRAML